MEINNRLFESLKAYYNSLFNTGYRKQSDVNKLLVYDFITELLTGDLRIYVTESDYKQISNALNCLYGSSCVIPYPAYLSQSHMLGNTFSDSSDVRISENNNNIMITESSYIRFRI